MIIRRQYAGGVQGLLQRIASLGEPEAYVGVPSSENARQGVSNNATIAATHELGAPSRGIPARPFLIPTMKENSTRYKDLMAQGFRSVLAGESTAEEVYEKIGLVASNDVKAYIVSGSFVPLKQSTIDRKGSSKPLIDTGELRNSISWEVRK